MERYLIPALVLFSLVLFCGHVKSQSKEFLKIEKKAYSYHDLYSVFYPSKKIAKSDFEKIMADHGKMILYSNYINEELSSAVYMDDWGGNKIYESKSTLKKLDYYYKPKETFSRNSVFYKIEGNKMLIIGYLSAYKLERYGQQFIFSLDFDNDGRKDYVGRYSGSSNEFTEYKNFKVNGLFDPEDFGSYVKGNVFNISIPLDKVRSVMQIANNIKFSFAYNVEYLYDNNQAGRNRDYLHFLPSNNFKELTSKVTEKLLNRLDDSGINIELPEDYLSDLNKPMEVELGFANKSDWGEFYLLNLTDHFFLFKVKDRTIKYVEIEKDKPLTLARSIVGINNKYYGFKEIRTKKTDVKFLNDMFYFKTPRRGYEFKFSDNLELKFVENGSLANDEMLVSYNGVDNVCLYGDCENGEGLYIHDETLSGGKFENNLLSGFGYMWNLDGSAWYKGGFKEDKFNGEGTVTNCKVSSCPDASGIWSEGVMTINYTAQKEERNSSNEASNGSSSGCSQIVRTYTETECGGQEIEVTEVKCQSGYYGQIYYWSDSMQANCDEGTSNSYPSGYYSQEVFTDERQGDDLAGAIRNFCACN